MFSASLMFSLLSCKRLNMMACDHRAAGTYHWGGRQTRMCPCQDSKMLWMGTTKERHGALAAILWLGLCLTKQGLHCCLRPGLIRVSHHSLRCLNGRWWQSWARRTGSTTSPWAARSRSSAPSLRCDISLWCRWCSRCF